MLITMIVALVMARKLLVQDKQIDWQGTTSAVCKETKNTQIQILLGQGKISKNFTFQHSIFEGTLEIYLSTQTEFQIHIDNIQYAPNLVPNSAFFCNDTIYFVQYRINFKTISQGFFLQISNDGDIRIGPVYLTLTTCPEDCIFCRTPDSCDQCSEGYQNIQGKCLCNFFYEGKCLEQCPANTRVLSDSYYCQKIGIQYLNNIDNQTTLVRVENSLSQQNFIFEQEQLIGPFKINQEIQGQFELRTSIVAIEFELYLFNSLDEYTLLIYLNEEWIEIIKTIDYNFAHNIKILSERKCLNQEDCIIYQLQTYAINHNSSQSLSLSISVQDINQILYQRNIALLDHSLLEWAISNLTILQINKTEEPIQACALVTNNTCFKCLGHTILYNNSCVTNCPQDTITRDGQCIRIPNYNQYAEILVYQDDLSDDLVGGSFLGEKQQFTNDDLRNVIMDGKRLFGGRWAENEFTEVYHLSKHYRLSISAMIKFVDSQNGYFYIKVNGEQRYQVFAQGNSSLKNQTDINMLYTFNHLDPNIMITTGCHDDNFGQCYLSEYTIVQHRCYPYCLECTGNQKQDCTKFSQKFSEFDYLKQDCIDGYFLRQRECSKCQKLKCRTCTEFHCSDCFEGYSLRHGLCIEQL